MQSTTNYSMNLVEGTDLVNIPVQLNPNFQTVDAEMFKNKQAGIGTATEVVTGTVHAVVRSNPDADMFRFTATGAWTAGDTMTLDGSAVTVHLADGTAPATGAYIIGAEVVAVVNGTLVTLLTSAAQPAAGVTSFNSRTGVVVPAASDYDGSMIDYDNTLSGLTATDVQSAIDELASEPKGFNYSETEHVCGTWINGETLYEKTVDCGAAPNNTTKDIAHNISNLGFIVGLEGIGINTGNKTATPLVLASYSSLANQMSFYATSTMIKISAGADQSSYNKCYVTLRYTKTV